MQRVEPRPADNTASQGQDQGAIGKQWSLPTGFASTGSQPHTQSFEEIYGVPENFLEIEVYPPLHRRQTGHCAVAGASNGR